MTAFQEAAYREEIQWLKTSVARLERELAEARERGELQETKLHNECQAHERTKRKLARWHRAFADILADKEINQFDVPAKEAEGGGK